MAYFGGGGVRGNVHPSLRAYIECFLSSPFPKMFPRGGGIWDQDPILMRDFRIIQNFEREWKLAQDQIESMQSGGGAGGGNLGIEDALNSYIDSMEDNY